MDSSSDIMNMEEGANANNLFSPRVPVDYSKVRIKTTMTQYFIKPKVMTPWGHLNTKYEVFKSWNAFIANKEGFQKHFLLYNWFTTVVMMVLSQRGSLIPQ